MANEDTGGTKATVYDVLRKVIDGLFRVGGITDTDHSALHEVVNDADPAAAAAAEKAKTQLSDAEKAELERLQAKQAASQEAGQAPAPAAEPEQAPAPAAAPPYPGPVTPPASPFTANG